MASLHGTRETMRPSSEKLPPQALREYEGRRLGIIAAVREAQAAEKQRESRLRRAKTRKEVATLEKRFKCEREIDAKRIADLNQERLDSIKIFSTIVDNITRQRVDGKSLAGPATCRDIPATQVKTLEFYRRVYGKLDSKAHMRRKAPKPPKILEPIPESSKLSKNAYLHERKALLLRYRSLVEEEEALVRDQHIERPRSSASSISSVASAATVPIPTPRRVLRPHLVPKLPLTRKNSIIDSKCRADSG